MWGFRLAGMQPRRGACGALACGRLLDFPATARELHTQQLTSLASGFAVAGLQADGRSVCGTNRQVANRVVVCKHYNF